MRIDIVTLFPDMFAPLHQSIVKRACEAGLAEIHVHQLRSWTTDRHHVVDDVPYGGGAGMVLKPEPLFRAVRDVQGRSPEPAHVVLTSPQGAPFCQERAVALSRLPRLIIVCGHYEGIDQRVIDVLVDEEISMGDFVLTGGEIPAMAIVDSIVRLVPGVIDEASLVHESFTDSLLDFPHYTRPREFEGLAVPEVLLGGHHAQIEQWRRQESLRQTWLRRPDLLEKANLSQKDRAWLEDVKRAVSSVETCRSEEDGGTDP